MVDFDKTYKVGFDTRAGIRNLAKLDKVLEKVDKNAKDLEKSFDKMGRTLGETKRDFDKTGRAAKEAGKDIRMSLGRKAREPVEKLARAAARAQLKVKSIGDTAVKVGRKMSSIGKKMSIGLTLPFVAAGVASLKFARDLNEGMANVSTLMDGGVEDVKRLKVAVQDMSVSSGKSTDDLTEGLFQVISAFGETADNVAQLQVVTDASVAGRSTTVEALELLSAVTKGYGDTSAEALTKVSNLAFMTNKLGQTTFPELAASITKVVPLAATFKTSQEDLFGVFATATGITGNAAEVATQLSSVYSGMLKPTEDLQKLVEKLGFKSAVSMVKTKGFSGAMNILREEVGGSAEEIGKLFTRKEAQLLLFSLLGNQVEEFSVKTAKMGDISTATADALRRQNEEINKQGFQWNVAKARMAKFAQNVGDKLLPITERFFKKLDPWLKKIEAMDDATLQWWIEFVALHAAIGPVLIIAGTLAKSIGALSVMMKASNVQTALMKTSGKGVATVMDANTKSVRNFNKALGAMAIIAAGVDFSNFIRKAFVEPFESKQTKRETDAENTINKTKDLLSRKGGLGFKEKTAALQAVQNAQADLPGLQTAPSNVLGNAVSVFTGEESPLQRISKKAVMLGIQERKLKASIQADLDDPTIQYRRDQRILRTTQSQAAQLNPLTRGNISITINGAGGTPAANAREIKRVLKDWERREDRKYSNASRSTGVSQQ